MLVTIGGKRWELTFERMSAKYDGDCDPPNHPGKRIRIRRSLRGQDKLDTIIHEVLHAADWWKDEEWIGQIATDLARILTKLGYTDGKATTEMGTERAQP